MKELTLKVIEKLENMENDFDISIIELAVYLHFRYGKTTLEGLDEQDFKIIQDELFGQETLFNENINDFMEINFDL